MSGLVPLSMAGQPSIGVSFAPCFVSFRVGNGFALQVHRQSPGGDYSLVMECDGKRFFDTCDSRIRDVRKLTGAYVDSLRSTHVA